MINNLIYSQIIDQLIEDGKYLQALQQIYIESTGIVVISSIILFTLGSVLYIRYQSIVPATFFGIIAFLLIGPKIPGDIYGLILVLITLGIASIIYWLFIRERR